MKRPRTKYPDRTERGYRGAVRPSCESCGSDRTWVVGKHAKSAWLTVRYHECQRCGFRQKSIEVKDQH